MRKQYLAWGAWGLTACLLYFFENNTGTRILLLASLLPLLPMIRPGFFGREEAEQAAKSRTLRRKDFSPRGEEEPGDVREYRPGDPVNRIHWKLSARQEKLMIREAELSRENAEREYVPAEVSEERRREVSAAGKRTAEDPAEPGRDGANAERQLSAGSEEHRRDGANAERQLSAGSEEHRRDGAGAADVRAEHTKQWIRKRFRIRPAGICLAAAVLSAALLLLLPGARLGLQALLNRLFAASEAVNAYAYEYFQVPAGQAEWPAVVLLILTAVFLLAAALLSGARWPFLLIIAVIALFQVYFGLCFPAWVQVMLLLLFAAGLLRRPWNRRALLYLAGGIGAVCLAVALIFPGVHGPTEAASEEVRDRLGSLAQSVSGAVRETPAGENETRHVHTQSLSEGELEARPGREYRLVTVEEEQISIPHWVNYLQIALQLLLTAGAVLLPFLPFIWMSRQQRKALEARQVFQSEDVREAVFAIFQTVTRWLEFFGCGSADLPYAAWQPDPAPGYGDRFAACEKIFEEAAYSDHDLEEEKRQQALDLLKETEEILRKKAGWRMRMRLKYREGLWV